MAAASRLGRQIEEVIASLTKVDARFALIATQDINLLTDSEMAQDIDRVLIGLGYHCLHRNANAGN